MAELRGLLVDYGGVLTNPLPEIMGSWLRRDRIDPRRFSGLMQRWLSGDVPGNPVQELETGRMGVAEFERRLAAELVDHAGAADPAESTRAAGVRTGLLSNSWGLDYSREDWAVLFDAVVISGEVGLRKPDPAIYALAAERIGLAPAEIVFVDDLSPNVRGAVAAGMVGVLHTDVGTTAEELEILLGVSLR